MIQGPNVKKLIVRKMALLIVPRGSNTGLGDVVDVLKGGRLGDVAREATDWVEAALRAVKSASGNPYGDDDEAIAGEILRGIDKKRTTLTR
jgi:hypothetical protein